MKKNVFKLFAILAFLLSFSNSIYAQNTPPTFTSTAITNIGENQTYTYNITTHDADGDAVTVTAPILPSWLSLTTSATVSTFAGNSTGAYLDGTGTAAQFNGPSGVAVDGVGNVYVADSNNNRIRKITAAGVVTTLAGSSGTGAYLDGTGTAAKFNFPTGVAVDGSGNLYVADYYNHRIRKITVGSIQLTGDTTGKVGTHDVVLNANDAHGGSTNQIFTITVNDITAPTVSTLVPADNATSVLIGSNLVLTFSENVQKGTGNILIKDAADNSTVQTIDVTTSAVSISSAVVTINPTANLLKSKNYYIQIPNTAFKDNATSPNAYAGIADTATWNFATELNTAPTASSVSFSGTVEVGQQLTSSYTYTDADSDTESGSTYKWYRSDDNTGTNKAAISGATAITYTLVTADAHKYISFEVTPNDGTAFGTAVESPLQAVVNSAPTFTSTAITNIDENQTYTYTITTHDADSDAVTLAANTLPSWLSLTVTTGATVSTLAGDGTPAYLDGTGTASQFQYPYSVAVDGAGTVYVADTYNNRIRKITSAGVVSTLAGSTGGFADGTGMAAKFQYPTGVAVDGAGTVYVADTNNHRIRKITSLGVVSTLAGSGTGAYLDGTGTAAKFQYPTGVAVDGSGTVYVADQANHRIRKITSLGVVSTLAGDGTGGFAGGTGTAAKFWNPSGVAVDVAGTVYVADYSNNRIRKITSLGVVSTLAGSSGAGAYLDGTGTAAKFDGPTGVAVDGSGNVYVADRVNSRIRKITVGSIQLTGDTTGKVGTHNVVLNANDGNGGSTNQSFTITVNDITPPSIVTTIPADNATGVSASNLQIDFNENMQKSTGDILIKRVSNDQVVATIPVSGSEVVISNGTVTITISPTTTLPSNADLYVVIPNTAFTDMSGNAFAGLTTNTLWNFSTSTVLGIEANIIKGFALYPNPVKGVLNIRAQETLKTIQVFNLMGQQVFLRHLNSNKTTINLNRLPQGSYFVKIITDKTTKSVKLIKH